MALLSTLLLSILFLGLSVSLAAEPIVHAPWGDVAGRMEVDEDGNRMNTFLGIPFALPPVGQRRFQKPQAHPGVPGIFNASSIGNACLQVIVGTGDEKFMGQEDCLTLNVYVPEGNVTSSPRAVLVWIYGGGFFVGAAKWYDPTPLVTVGDVIAVTIQYRLGPFGFISTMDDAAKGNYGLWDQLLALKWIKKNIGAFGGDPDQITVIGESSGAASVGLLTISPEAKGLFKRAILQSGSATSSFTIETDTPATTARLGKRVGCLQQDHNKLIACLRGVDADTLVMESWPISKDPVQIMLGAPYGPVVDGEFIIGDPRSLITSPHRLENTSWADVDVMLGVNNNEGGDLYGGASLYDTLLNTSLFANLAHLNFYKHEFLPYYIKHFYGYVDKNMVDVASFEYQFPNIAENPNPQVVYDTKTDASFLAPAVEFARTHSSSTGKGRTYLYYFDHFPQFPGPSGQPKGMQHAFDLLYTFGFNQVISKGIGVNSTLVDPSEFALSLKFRKMLTMFAKTGDPSSALIHDLPKGWPEYDTDSEQYLDFTTNMRVDSHVARRRVSVWLDLLPKFLPAKQPLGQGDAAEDTTLYKGRCPFLYTLINSK